MTERWTREGREITKIASREAVEDDRWRRVSDGVRRRERITEAFLRSSARSGVARAPRRTATTTTTTATTAAAAAATA